MAAEDKLPDLENDLDELNARRWFGGEDVVDDRLPLDVARPAVAPGPGVAARLAAGDRQARAAAGASSDDPIARDNWRLTGPRNVGGRVRALAAAPLPPPRDNDIWFAGTASGGVYKTVNAGESWFPVMHDQPSLAIAALAVGTAPAGADQIRVYAATGEVVTNGFGVGGFGIWVSSDSGATWTNHHTPPPLQPNPPHRLGFDAIAVDPSDPDHCWAVGREGVYRTINAGIEWVQFENGQYWSDVAFLGGALYLARGARTTGPADVGEAVVVRLDLPAALAAPLQTATNTTQLLTVTDPDDPWPRRVKLAVAVDGPNTLVFARVADEYGNHMGLFRTADGADAPFNGASWVKLKDHNEWADEGQGTYNLCIAVDPDNPQHLATGMQQLWATDNATAAPNAVNFRQIMSWELHDHGLREHHADHHQLIARGDDLWVADDGGIARSGNWKTGEVDSRRPPLAANAVTWRNLDDGISAAQMYDLEQSPLLPTVYGGGLQDNGVYMTSGGPTWRNIFGADGGFVLFDPDDPYSMIVTWYRAIQSIRFPSHFDRTFPDEQPPGALPEPRILAAGFERFDPPAFVADSDYHPRRRARLLHGRRSRLYGLRGGTGEEWKVEPVGRGLDFRFTEDGDRLTVRLHDTPAAHRLGLIPGTTERRQVDDPQRDGRPRPLTVAFTGRIPEPFEVTAGDVLWFTVNGADQRVALDVSSIADPDQATTAEVIAAFGTAHANTEVLPRFWTSFNAIELITTATGSTATITLDGSATDELPDAPHDPVGLSRLGLNKGTYKGADGHPASVTIAFRGSTDDERLINRDFSNPTGQTLTVSINAGTTRSITIDTPHFPDPSFVTVGELAAALEAALDNDPVKVVACTTVKAVVIRAHPGRSVAVTGTAATRLGLPSTPAEQVVITERAQFRRLRSHWRNHNSFDLGPATPVAPPAPPRGADPLDINITDGTNPTGPHNFTAGEVANLRSVTVEELFRILSDHVASTPGLAVDVELVSYVANGQPNEVRYSRASPDEVWVGTEGGLVHRSTDDGATWTTLGDGQLTFADGRTEAIAIHPSNQGQAYVAHWSPYELPTHHSLIHRTRDGGATWVPIGIVHDGAVPAVHALEIHPENTQTIFAATDAGVFWSRDEGEHWEPFNSGLPNTAVTDLTVEPSRPLLRATAWGRGVFERSIGSAPPDDVRLLIRANQLDDGTDRSTTAGPSVFSLVAETAARPASPDIKVVRVRPAEIGATDALIDGVEFDLELPNDDVVPTTDATVFLQIHNRGSQPARSRPDPNDPKVRVVLLWAPLDTGSNLDGAPPPLPPSFWTDFRLGTPLVTLGEWQLVEAEKTLLGDPVGGNPTARDITAGEPEIISFSIAWPAIVADRIAVLAIVSADDDEVTRGPLDIDSLLATERRVAYREVSVVQPEQDHTLLLKATGDQRFQVVSTGSNVLTQLGIGGPLQDNLTSEILASPAGAATYDLGVASPQIIVAAEPITVAVDFDNVNGEFANLAAARPVEIANVIAAKMAQIGVPVWAFPSSIGARLRATGDVTVQVTGGSAAGPLGFLPAAAANLLTTTAQPDLAFDLSGDPVLDLRIRAHATDHDVPVTFSSERFRDPAQVSGTRVARIINEALAARNLRGAVSADPIYGIGIYGDGQNGNDITIEPSANAVALFNFPAGSFSFFEGNSGIVDLSAKPTVTFTVNNRIAVRFRQDAAVSPAEVRRTINTAMEYARIPVRAVPPKIALRLRSSTTDPGGPRPETGGTGLVEITNSILNTVDPADRPALFDTRLAIADDRVDANQPNIFYVRCWNEGNITATATRFRLFQIDLTTSPIVPDLIDAAEALDIPAGGSAIADFDFNDLSIPEVLFVLAVVDQHPSGPAIAVPGVDAGAGFADLGELVSFRDSNPSVAVRRFDVIT